MSKNWFQGNRPYFLLCFTMNISFTPLQKNHFPLLLKWLQAPHVKAWWSQSSRWTTALVTEKYDTYVDGYKVVGEDHKPIHAYVIKVDDTPVGYIHHYNVRDFFREYDYSMHDLPPSCAGFDWYIGEATYIGKGIGTKVLELFLNTIVLKTFKAVFIDADSKNVIAIRVYEKVGFKKLTLMNNGTITLMLKNQ